MYTIKPTPQFRQDYKRAKRKGLDLHPLNAAVKLLAAGETLPAAAVTRGALPRLAAEMAKSATEKP